MDEILRKLAEAAGISPDTARNGLGAVLTYLKEHLPEGLFGQVEGAVPDSDAMVKAFETNKTSSGGGLLGSVVGMAGKLLGGSGGDAAKLIEMLGSAGLNMGQISAFLPKVLEFLRSYLPPEVATKLQDVLDGVLKSAPAEGA